MIRRVGMRIGYAENNPETQARLAALRQGLKTLGWMEGRNILIDYRFAPADPDQAQSFAKELVGLRPDALVANSTPATAALLHETHIIPAVFVGVSDPVRAGQHRLHNRNVMRLVMPQRRVRALLQARRSLTTVPL